MAYRSIRIAGLQLACHANASGAGMSFSMGGPWWDSLMQRRVQRREQALAPAPIPARPAPVDGVGAEAAALQAKVDPIVWYHTLDLGHGIVTPGQFDHRDIVPKYRLPETLAGKRVLDVATFDGFWAFEFERRGAREVVALDLDAPSELDWPPKRKAAATEQELSVRFGDGFRLAHEAIGSRVQRVGCSVYDLSPEKYGMFEVVHAGDFLIHLNSPVRALQRIASVTSDYALISDVVFPELDRPGSGALMEYMGGSSDVTWWKFSVAALERMVLDAGFSRVERLSLFKYGPRGVPGALHHLVLKAWK
jgi:tRNA (mo5U34)-methyltransferase